MKRTPLARKTPLQARKAMRKRSPKRAAYMASQERTDAVAHMLAVKALPCVACGAAPPSEAHHCTANGMARDDWATIPLCYACHRGPQGYHAAKRSWVARHGQDVDFLPIVAALTKNPRPKAREVCEDEMNRNQPEQAKDSTDV
jgi:hypothetical protein